MSWNRIKIQVHEQVRGAFIAGSLPSLMLIPVVERGNGPRLASLSLTKSEGLRGNNLLSEACRRDLLEGQPLRKPLWFVDEET